MKDHHPTPHARTIIRSRLRKKARRSHRLRHQATRRKGHLHATDARAHTHTRTTRAQMYHARAGREGGGHREREIRMCTLRSQPLAESAEALARPVGAVEAVGQSTHARARARTQPPARTHARTSTHKHARTHTHTHARTRARSLSPPRAQFRQCPLPPRRPGALHCLPPRAARDVYVRVWVWVRAGVWVCVPVRVCMRVWASARTRVNVHLKRCEPLTCA